MNGQSNKEIGGSLLEHNFLKNLSTAALANFVQPIFTLFLPLLAYDLGASVLELGILGGASSLVYAFMPFVMGRFSDRGRARWFLILVSLALLSSVSVLYSFAYNPVALILLRILEGVGWAAFWPSIDSAVSHDAQVDPRRALSIFNLSWSSTAALGPLVGSFVVVIFSVRDVFVFNATFLVLALILNLLPRPSRRTPKRAEENNSVARMEAEEISPPHEVSTNTTGSLKVSPFFYILSLMMCTIASNTTAAFLSPYGRSQGIPILIIGAISFTYGVARFSGYLVTTNERARHYLLDPGARLRNIFALLGVLAGSTLFMLVPDRSGTLYFVSFGLIGLSYSLVYFIAMIAFVAETRRERMGAGAGVFESSIGLGSLAGPFIAGAISGNSLALPFVVPSLSAVPIFSILFVLSRRSRKREC